MSGVLLLYYMQYCPTLTQKIIRPMHPRPWLMPTSTLYLLNALYIAQVNTLCNCIYGSTACGGVCIYGLYSSFLCWAFYNSIVWNTKVAFTKRKKAALLPWRKAFWPLLILLPMVGDGLVCVMCSLIMFIYTHTHFLLESRFGQHCTVNGFISEDDLMACPKTKCLIGQYENAN